MSIVSNIPNQTHTPSLQNYQWESFCSQIKQTMTGTEEEKDHILRRRILKFFHNFSLERNRYYVNRREIGGQNYNNFQISNNSILLYGIDFLPQPKIEQYFYPFQVSIQYYDDSHCSVTFQNYQNLIKAVYARLHNNTNQNIQQFYVMISSSEQKRLQWRQLVPYYQLCFQRLLWFRFLTSSDFQNKGQLGQAAVYKTYLLAKDAFFKDILRAKEDSQLNKRSRIRQNSRQHSFDRSRSKEKQRNSKKYEQFYSGKREQRDKYSNVTGQCKLCNCRIYREVKRFIEQIQNKTCCKRTYKPKRKYEQIQEQTENQDLNRRKTAIFTNESHQNIPISRLASRISQKQVLSKSFKTTNATKSSQCSKQDNIEDDLTFNSLVKDLQRYHFNDQPSHFEDYMSPVKPNRNSISASNNEQQRGDIEVQEYSVFEMIEEQ